MSTPDRFDLIHEQYLEEWVEANLRHLYEVCADYIPWTDAEPSSDEEGAGPWVARVEDPAPTGWQEPSSSSEPSAA